MDLEWFYSNDEPENVLSNVSFYIFIIFCLTLPNVTIVILSFFSFWAIGTGFFPFEKPSVIKQTNLRLCFRAFDRISLKQVIFIIIFFLDVREYVP